MTAKEFDIKYWQGDNPLFTPLWKVSEAYNEYKTKELREALEEAIIGLEWWNSEHPQDSKECDLSKIEKWKGLLGESNETYQQLNYNEIHNPIKRRRS